MREEHRARLDPQAVGKLLDEHAAALQLFARQWCDIPEDIVQDAFLKLVTLKKLPDTVVPWLYRVVRNRAISASRASARRRRREAQWAESQQDWFTLSPGQGLDAAAAAQALRTLPPEQRETIVARLWGGLTFEEIGQVTSCVASTAHRRYSEGLAALRERLGINVER